MIFVVGFTGSLLALVGLALLSLGATRPSNLGARNGSLSVCPDSPNCVTSSTSSQPHLMPPITYEGEPQIAMQTIIDVVSVMDGARVVSSRDGYIYCEFSTSLFRFVDDVEFLLDADQSVIHFRSASRVGHYDFNLNRRRINEIRRRFIEASSVPESNTSQSRVSFKPTFAVGP